MVQLSGFVDSDQRVKMAGEIAGSVEGVKSVQNDLIVKEGETNEEDYIVVNSSGFRSSLIFGLWNYPNMAGF